MDKKEEARRRELELSYLIVGLAALFAVVRLWERYIHPAIDPYAGITRDVAGAPVLRLGPWLLSSVDVVTIVAIGLCLYVLVPVALRRAHAAAWRRDVAVDDEGGATGLR